MKDTALLGKCQLLLGLALLGELLSDEVATKYDKHNDDKDPIGIHNVLPVMGLGLLTLGQCSSEFDNTVCIE